MMFEEKIDSISDREWEDALDAHLTWGETWHGDLPPDVFFGVWAALAGHAKPLTVTVELGTARPTLTVPADSPLTVVDNAIVLEDGRELLIEFSSAGQR
jgi:hypothetical protein